MSAFGGLILTNKGRNLQAKAQAGAQLNFTRIAVGDGSLDGTSILDLNALKNEVKSLSITKLKTMTGGKAVVGTVFSNETILVGFYWRELGVFAQDPDLGEILYCYGNAGINAEYIPAGGGPDIIEKSIDVVTIVGNAANVTATIESSLVYTTAQEFNDAVDNINISLATKETPAGAQEKASAAQTAAQTHADQADTAHTLAADPHAQYALDTDVSSLAGVGRTTETVKGVADVVAGHLADLVHQVEVHGLRATNGKLEYYTGTEWKTVSGGLPVGNVSAFTATAGNARVTLKWGDPIDVVLDGATLAAWQGTKILRKTGSYPVNENDGVLVVDSGIRDQYASIGFIDTGLTNDAVYYYMAFPYTTEDIYTVDVVSRATATPKAYVIYGVKIDTTNSNPATALTYTDNAIGFTPATGNNGSFNAGSWADKFPFNQIKPCLLKPDLTVNYYLNPSNYAQKADGTPSNITTGADGDVMVEFPKIWWKFETVGTDLYVRYADAQIDANYKCLAHLRGITEKDKCYISAYLGHNLSSKLRSLSGKAPTATQTIGAFRTLAQANGTGYDQIAYFQLLMLQVLFIVMFKNRDSQTALGRGYVDGNVSAINTGGTNAKGMFFGSTNGSLQNKFCGIEDFYGNLRYWIDGFFSDTSRNMLIGTQSFNDTGSGYTNYGQGSTSDLSGYISGVQGGTESGFIVKATAGSTTTFYADGGYLSASRLPIFGGDWTNADIAGAFSLAANLVTSTAYATVGARLLAL